MDEARVFGILAHPHRYLVGKPLDHDFANTDFDQQRLGNEVVVPFIRVYPGASWNDDADAAIL